LAPLKVNSVLSEEGVLLVLRGAPFVAVVQATHVGKRDDAASRGPSDRPRDGRVFFEGKMSPGAQVVLHVVLQDAVQPTLMADDDVIEALSANGLDKSLDVRVLPR